jgi:NADPH-dependent 7-cyano-7-deazaguanine reductase QueF
MFTRPNINDQINERGKLQSYIRMYINHNTNKYAHRRNETYETITRLTSNRNIKVNGITGRRGILHINV